MLNVGEWLQIVNLEGFIGKAAEVIEVKESTYLVRLMNGSEIDISKENAKRKKMCTCGQTGRGPFCDGSHSRH